VRRKLHAAVAQRVRRASAALLCSTLWRLASHAAVRLIASMFTWCARTETTLSRSAASGAIFNHVLLWRPTPPAEASDVVRPCAILRGHEGAIHRLAWHDAGTLLCSVSEDRSARLWDTREAWTACGTPHQLQPAASLFGHTGRVWDAVFLDDGMLATVAEDSTARLWRLDGTHLAAIQGHRGRGIWRCAAAGGSLATGGADGGVKLWRLADWLPREHAAEHASAGGTDTLVFAEPLAAVIADAPRVRGKECVPNSKGAANAPLTDAHS
jgi:WD40 repeat protein